MAWLAAAIVFIGCLALFPRFVLGIFVLCVLAGVGVFAYYKIDSYIAELDKSKVEAVVSTKSDCNTPGRPIEITITNNNNKSLEYVSFNLSAKRTGFSSEIYSDWTSSDRILPANYWYKNCWSLNSYKVKDGRIGAYDVRELEWSAKITDVRFGAQ
jgi:hypothetical protein